jgi:hypothetical protein
MSADDAAVRAHLAAGRDFNDPRCRNSAGLATDEPPPRLPGEHRRIYLFSPVAWKAQHVNDTLRLLHRRP